MFIKLHLQKEEKEIVEIAKCPLCGGSLVEKKTKRGKSFYGCSNYPKCKAAAWYPPTGELCPKCNSLMINKKDTILCSECGYEKE